MNDLAKWFKNHSISAHSIVIGWCTVDALWYTSQPFKDYVWGIYSAMPRSVHGFVAGIVVPVLVYWQAKKRLTVSAEVSPGQTETVAATATVPSETK